VGSFVEDIVYVVGEMLRPSCLLSECVIKYLFLFCLRCWTLSLIYSLMTSSICVKYDPGTHMRYIWSSFKTGCDKLAMEDGSCSDDVSTQVVKLHYLLPSL